MIQNDLWRKFIILHISVAITPFRRLAYFSFLHIFLHRDQMSQLMLYLGKLMIDQPWSLCGHERDIMPRSIEKNMEGV